MNLDESFFSSLDGSNRFLVISKEVVLLTPQHLTIKIDKVYIIVYVS